HPARFGLIMALGENMTTPVKTPRRASAKVLPTRRRITERKPEWPGVTSCGRSAVGSASPCQGEGRGFESRRPLDCGGIPQLDRAHAWSTHTAEWPSGLGKGLQSPVHGFDSRLRLARLAQRESATLTR